MGKDCHVVIRRERVDHPVPDVDVESYIMEQRSSSRRGGVGAMGGNVGGEQGGMQRFMCDGDDDDGCTEQQRQAKMSSTGYVWKIGLYQRIVSFIHVSYATLSLLGRTIRI